MSAPNEGRQSPPPEDSKGSQIGQPSDGQGISQGGNNQDESKKTLEELSSNPKGPLDDHVKEVAKKTTDPSQSSK